MLGAADGEWGAGPPLGGEGAAARRPERMGAGTERRERLLHLQPPARRGRRSRVAASAQGSRALRARSLAEADPAPGERARVRPPGDLTRRSVHGLQADAAAADAAGEAIRPPARPPARARPPTPRSARRSLHPLGRRLLRPSRPQLRPPPEPRPGARAHELGRSRGLWHHVAAPPPPPPLCAPPAPSPRPCAGGPRTADPQSAAAGRWGGRRAGRKEGGRPGACRLGATWRSDRDR